MLDDCHESFKIIYPAHGFSVSLENRDRLSQSQIIVTLFASFYFPGRNPERASFIEGNCHASTQSNRPGRGRNRPICRIGRA
jgi:hypothetical protein